MIFIQKPLQGLFTPHLSLSQRLFRLLTLIVSLAFVLACSLALIGRALSLCALSLVARASSLIVRLLNVQLSERRVPVIRRHLHQRRCVLIDPRHDP